MGQEPSFGGATWDGISDDAKDFVQRLLNKCALLRHFVACLVCSSLVRGSTCLHLSKLVERIHSRRHQ